MEFIRRLGIPNVMRSAPAFAPAFLACAAFAASEGEHREHEAHEHGHGTLDIVLEGEELAIELRIPAVNVVGFEHAPRDETEREAVRKALVPFGDAASVLELPAEAECEVEAAKGEIWSMADEDDHAGDDGHEHESDEHGAAKGHDEEEHDEEGHAEDEHEDHDADSGGEAHSELHATYRFHCHAPGKLDRIDLRAFEHLHGAEEIDVRIVTPTAQLATEIHPGETVISLGP